MPLEIIGPGFGRTGTNSLKLALEHLGFGPCHHMFEVRDNPALLSCWEAAARGEPDEWFDSVQATIAPFVAARGTHPSLPVNAITEMGYRTVVVQVFDNRMSDRDHATRAFKQHISDVQSEIPADRLLTFDLREGWPPLCEFLGVEGPNIPFPKTNSSKAFVDKEWS